MTRTKKKTKLESSTIDVIPVSDRHGSIWHQGPFWFYGNFQFIAVALGFIGPNMDLSFSYSVVAGILGIIFGTVFMALHASQGPEMGLPQMIQSRAQFGYSGVAIPLVSAIIMFIGFDLVNAVIMSDGLNEIYHVDVNITLIVVIFLGMLLAVAGHDILHYIFRTLFFITLPVFVLFTALIFWIPVHDVVTKHCGYNSLAFINVFAAAAAFNITYAPYVSDYTRYLPENSNRYLLILNVFCGAALSPVWLMSVGTWLAVSFNSSNALFALFDAGNAEYIGFGSLVVILSSLALIANMGMITYSGGMSLLTIISSLRPNVKTKCSNFIGYVIIGVFTIVFGLISTANSMSLLYSALTIMLYLLVPWTSINLTDYFLIRKRDFNSEELIFPNNKYGLWNMKGLLSYCFGLAVSLPFIWAPPMVQGPLYMLYGKSNIGWVNGLVASSLFFYYLTRRKGKNA